MANNQGQFDMQKFILSVVLVGITLVLGIYITDTIGQVVDAPNTPASIVNETGAWINSTIYVVDQSTEPDFGALSITALFNTTDGTSIGLLNITSTSTGFYNATAVLYNDVLVSYGYTYTAQTNSSVAALAVVDALATGTTWISILVVVGFATIILTMLTVGLGQAAREQATPYY
jgi:hypothetical protein